MTIKVKKGESTRSIKEGEFISEIRKIIGNTSSDSELKEDLKKLKSGWILGYNGIHFSLAKESEE